MKVELPRVHNGMMFFVRVYSPAGVNTCSMISELVSLDVPDDTYLVIAELRKTPSGAILASWGYDRVQWLNYQPEYHNPARLAPQPKVEPEKVEEPRQPVKSAPKTFRRERLAPKSEELPKELVADEPEAAQEE